MVSQKLQKLQKKIKAPILLNWGFLK